MDQLEIRQKSLKLADKLGYQTNSKLPVLEGDIEIRPVLDVVARIMALYATIAVSYGFSATLVSEWLQREGFFDALTREESAVLHATCKPTFLVSMQWRVESLWVLTWTCSFHSALNFAKPCDDSFIEIFPSLQRNESAVDFCSKAKLRPANKLVETLDVAYCIHWAIRQSIMDGTEIPNGMNERIILERRRALEWINGKEDWENISLDT